VRGDTQSERSVVDDHVVGNEVVGPLDGQVVHPFDTVGDNRDYFVPVDVRTLVGSDYFHLPQCESPTGDFDGPEAQARQQRQAQKQVADVRRHPPGCTLIHHGTGGREGGVLRKRNRGGFSGEPGELADEGSQSSRLEQEEFPVQPF
jgi:hypothetical protein